MSTTAHSAPKKVVLHVGAPKSGTTFLQRALWSNITPLEVAGFTCAGDRAQDMFRAAIEVRETFDYWGYEREALTGTWHRLCQAARAFEGTTIMSHELLGAATDEQAARAMAELEGLDVHVVFTARDLARQVTSEWQERVKNGSTVTFRRFQRSVERRLRQEDFSGSFWRSQDILSVLDRWGGRIPATHTHVVVAPQPGAAPEVLWHRFGDAVGFDAGALDPTSEGTANQTLGAVEVSILRQVNEALDGRIRQPHYARIVKRQFAQRLLAAQSVARASAKPRCPGELVDSLAELATAHNDVISARGYTVHGDLAELVPTRSADEGAAPDDVDPGETTAAAAAVIAELLVERAEKGPRRRTDDQAESPGSQRSVRRLGARVKRRLRG